MMKKDEMKTVNVERGMTRTEEEVVNWLAGHTYNAIRENLIETGCWPLLGDYLSILDTLNQAGRHRACHLILVLLKNTAYDECIPLIEILCKPGTEMLDTFVSRFLSRMYFEVYEDEEDEDDEDFGVCICMDDDYDCNGECDECPFYEVEDSCADDEVCHPKVRITAEAEGCEELITMIKEIISDLGLMPVETEESAGDDDE